MEHIPPFIEARRRESYAKFLGGIDIRYDANGDHYNQPPNAWPRDHHYIVICPKGVMASYVDEEQLPFVLNLFDALSKKTDPAVEITFLMFVLADFKKQALEFHVESEEVFEAPRKLDIRFWEVYQQSKVNPDFGERGRDIVHL
ncbi:hypothetical protein OQA88_13145 [Cercophora sp. LCS_1]